jgi:hypothetical protein
MRQRVIPKIESVHRINAIERLVRIGNLIAAGSTYFYQALCDPVAVEGSRHFDHCAGNIDAGHESPWRELGGPRKRPAVPEAHFKDPGVFLDTKARERSLIRHSRLKRHYSGDNAAQQAARMPTAGR